jgi:GDP-4-dehydro-6-deoxy-D-mannose reductase
MRVVVTGVSGFVGGHLADHLIDSDDLVIGVSASGRWPDTLSHLSSRLRLEAFDLVQDPESKLIDLIHHKQPEVIYHLAAQSNPQKSLQNPKTTWHLNLGGTLKLLEAVRQSGLKPRVLLISSGVCYGNPTAEYIPVRESCPLMPTNPYAASKAAADLLGIQHHIAYATDIIIVRPFNHAGPRQSDSYVLAALSRQLAEVQLGLRKQLDVGNLNVVRDFTDVRDVVRAYRLLALQGVPGEIYNLGSGEGTRLADALEYLISQVDSPVIVHTDPIRLRRNDQPMLVADPTKLKEATGWKPSLSIRQTLYDMLQYWFGFLQN